MSMSEGVETETTAELHMAFEEMRNHGAMTMLLALCDSNAVLTR